MAFGELSPSNHGTVFRNTDVSAVRSEYWFKPPRWIDSWLVRQLRDPRDAPMAYLMFNICTVSVPCAVALFCVRQPSHWLGFLYLLVSSGLFMQRFILCLHYVEHLQPFRDTWMGSLLSLLCPNILCVFYGIPPGIYRLHHIVMHHCENNLFPYDVSSTEPYQRDSFLQFLGYWCRFWAAIAVELPWYAVRRKRYGLALKAILSLTVYGSLGYFLYQVSPVATLWVMVIPFFVSSLAMMFGNWSQHVFVDPLSPRNNYRLTSELPLRFMESLDKHAQEDALVFEGIGFFDVGILVFTGQLGALADRYVNIGQKSRSKEDLVKLFQSRLQPICQKKHEKET